MALPGLKRLVSGLVKSARLSYRNTIRRGSRPLKVADAKDSLWMGCRKHGEAGPSGEKSESTLTSSSRTPEARALLAVA